MMKEQLQALVDHIKTIKPDIVKDNMIAHSVCDLVVESVEELLNPPPEPRPSKQERRQQFIADLKALLVKYHAEIEAENLWRGYAECGQDLQLTVSLDAVPGDDGSYAGKQEWDYFKLGYSVDYTDDIEAKDN